MTRRAAAIFAALAQGLDLPGVLVRFGLTPEELQQLFREAAAHFEQQEQGVWRLFCDGASRGNPGPAGAGAVLYDPEGQPRARLARYLGEATNNVAEYQALILGLKEARKHKVHRLQVFADSELLVRQLTGRYQVKSPHLLPLWQECVQELRQFAEFAIKHVPREENREADALANAGIDQKRQGR